MMFSFFAYTEAKLAKEIMQICRELMPSEQFAYNPEQRTVTSKKADIYLGNIFEQVKDKKRRERFAFITSFLRSALCDSQVNYESSSHRLVPRIKSAAEFHCWAEHLSLQSPSQLLHKPLTEHFVCMLGIDHETTIHSVMQSDLEQLDMTAEEAFKHALANLYQISDAPFIEIDEGLYMADLQDGHSAARLMLIEEIENLKLNGLPVAFLPTNEELFICGSEDFIHQAMLAPQCQTLTMEKKPLSLHTLMLKEGKWQDFYPPKTDDYAPVYNLHQIELATEYNEQKNQMDEKFEAQDIDIFVASHSLFERDDSPFFFSVCTWSENVHTYLPKADQVHFVANIDDEEPGVLGVLSWQDTLKHFGDLMKPQGMVPERYELTAFPDKNKLMSLLATSD